MLTSSCGPSTSFAASHGTREQKKVKADDLDSVAGPSKKMKKTHSWENEEASDEEAADQDTSHSSTKSVPSTIVLPSVEDSVSAGGVTEHEPSGQCSESIATNIALPSDSPAVNDQETDEPDEEYDEYDEYDEEFDDFDEVEEEYDPTEFGWFD